jgi:asparagine synthase (glutamine-hydrolysing)
MTNYLSSGDKRQLLRVPGSWPDSLDPLRQGLSRLGRQEPLHQVLYAFSQDWLVEDLLMKADKMSMAVSLEMRTPFLDYRLVEWAARTPARLKAGREADGSYRSKRVLRRLARELLPAAIVERPKLGFPVPVYDWLAGSCRDMAHDLLCSPATRCLSWLRPEALRRTVDLGTAAQAPILDRHRLWNLLILEFWAREWT